MQIGTEVGQKIDFNSFKKTHCEFYTMQELTNELRRNHKVWSWGTQAWMRMNSHCLRFKVNGHHHKGHVYLVVNGSDYFDIYFTTTHGTIKQIKTDVDISSLVDEIDFRVEYVLEYEGR